MQALEQIAEGATAEDMTMLDTLLLPMDTAVKSLADVQLNDAATHSLQHGQAVVSEHDIPEGKMVRAYQASTALFLGVAQVEADGSIAPKRLVVY